MVNNIHLISRLIRIEMYNLNNICPFVYKIATDNVILPLDGYSLKIDNKYSTDKSQQFVPLTNFYPTVDNKIIQNDEVDKPLCLSNVYFINGYNKYVPMLSHINSKYKMK